MMLRDFLCDDCELTFEAVADGQGFIHPCPRCGRTVNSIMSFKGYIRTGPRPIAPEVIKAAEPGGAIGQEREHSKPRDIEKKLPDGRKVRRISMDISDQVKPRDLHPNLLKDIERKAKK